MKRRPRPIGMHPLIAAGIRRAEKERKAQEIARPMRAMFDVLAQGEVTEVPIFDEDGRFLRYVAAMKMPEIDPALRQSSTDWVEIAPAIEGWIDCWARLAPHLKQDKLRYLSGRLRAGQELTPRLVEQAREEFDAAVRLIPTMGDGKILHAVQTAQIAFELERVA